MSKNIQIMGSILKVTLVYFVCMQMQNVDLDYKFQ